MMMFHSGALAALFVFSWKAFLLAVVLWWVAGSLGIGMGYHRLLTHRSYKTPKWIEYFLTCAVRWLWKADRFSGSLHIACIIRTRTRKATHISARRRFVGPHGLHNNSAELLPYVPDLRKDKFQVWISRWHWMPITAVGAIILVAGGWQYALWGIFFRTVIGLHSTWLVNSATHIWGTQRFPAHDPPKTAFGWRY
jgi:sn-1 stearoyl-lipid 9-desaturase